ncbi:cardiolipin synthase [Muricauda sp. HICW]|uniref:Cardiolipin synthase n=1 Tax=Flagellimonas chongwuensis TaxID=2697365 RepID=A0A850NJX8_9FLAO|nr:cardiolipin synthase [Allomuricauda chongwuensis]NVN19466.1 cardiolipin synthase [Allomuricauda chongwuensis]
MLIPILIALYILIALTMVVSLLLNGVRPSKTLAWLLAIFTIPVAGVLLYILFGRNRRRSKMFSLKNQFAPIQPLENANCNPQISDDKLKITHLINKTTHCGITCHNDLELLKDGKITFESIFEAIEGAKEHIHLQYYIFEDGELADRLLDIFERKVASNVTIRLLYDGIGSYSLSKKYLKKLKDIGVETAQFLPFKFGRFLASLNYRNHRKIIVIDNKIGFTGGINISDKYLRGDQTLGKWHDTHLKIEGEAVDFLNRLFVTDWFLASGKKVEASNFKTQAIHRHKTSLQIVPSGPDDDFDVMEQVYFSIINSSQKYLYIVNPYIIPNHAILQALMTAALSGVDVRILMSTTTDIKLVDWCVRAYFESYLKAGIKIYLYADGFLHSKVMLCDDEIASVGTANLDNRSLQQNYEAQVFVYDRDLCKRMKSDFFKDCEKSLILNDYNQYKERPWIQKLIQGFAKLLSPLL